MSAINFDLTPDVVKPAGYRIDGTTTPSYAEVEEMILEASMEIINLFDAKGISYTAPSSDTVKAGGWRIGRRYVKAAVREEITRMGDGDQDRADQFAKMARTIYDRVDRNAVTAAGGSADTTDDAADLPYYSKVDPVYDGTYDDYDEGPVTLGRKLIAQNEI